MKVLTIADNLKQTMQERYFQEGEVAPQQMIRRVADSIASGEYQYGWSDSQVSELSDEYYNTMNKRLWLPSSPFLMNAGTKVPMLSACFVVGGMEDNLDSIFETLKRSSNIWKMGGGTGFNWSGIREEGSSIDSTGGISSGVMSWMEIYNSAGNSVKQGGRRRVANMGILNVYHPEILKFIDYKLDKSKLNNFNISVMMDDAFMEAVINNEEYWVVSPKNKKKTRKLNAREVFDKIVENNWSSAEPAIIFVDSLNKKNPMVKFLGFITATNPCGEIPLYEDEACNLASINLEEVVDWNGNVNWTLLRYIVRLVTRFLDTSIDINVFPDNKIAEKVKSLRRLGVGIMSLHGALIKAGYRFSSPEGRLFAEKIMQFVNEESWQMSKELAEEKGVFPLFFESDFYNQGFIVRNVACTTIAPTGTIQQILNTSSSGCEPIFALAYMREILMADETKKKTFWVNPFFEEFAKTKGFWSDDLPELIYNNRGRAKGIEQIPVVYAELFETAMEISPANHVLMQGALQKWVDNSISKTINMPRESTVEEVSDAYILGWRNGLKGMTIYREGSREGVLTVGGDTTTEDKEGLKRGEVIQAPDESYESKTKKLVTGCGNIYLTMNKDEDGNIIQTFVDRGSKGTCMSNQIAVSRLISMALRGGISLEDVIDQLTSVSVCPSYYGRKCSGVDVSKGSSCPSALAFALKEYAKSGMTAAQVLRGIEPVKPVVKKLINDSPDNCPKCGEKMANEGGCSSCYACGFSKCS